MKVKFLHIPKTAGSSVRLFLSRFYLSRHICPARYNKEFLELPAERLPSYRLFMGHFNWTYLDQVNGPCFTFSVLREPTERLVSYYFYLRKQALRHGPEHLALPNKGGLRAALHWSPDEFFCGGDSLEVRRHLDGRFDNFYTYFFAGRTFGGRRRLKADMHLAEARILAKAGRHLDLLDGLYSTEDLAPLQNDIIAVCGRQGMIGRWGTLRASISPLKDMKLNTGQGHFSSRIAQLKSLGATNRTFDRIAEMTRLDRVIWADRFPSARSRLELI